ncbi:MAG: hypothetical protein ACHQT9_01750 [Candidatus Saccharimonadales bacterium]
MIKHNQKGAVSAVGVSLVISVVFLVAAIGFGVWAFMSRQDYKNNTDKKIADAIVVQQNKDSTIEKNQLAQDQKNPLLTYTGPSQYGGIIMKYPKTWSALIDDRGDNASAPVNAYFGSPVLSSVSDQNTIFALRMQVVNQAYANIVQSYVGHPSKSNPIVSSAYSLPSLPNVVGVKIYFQANDETLILLPLRASTIELWTTSSNFIDDFNNIILKNFTFSP